MPTIVHGVDVSALEGWMIKINTNPSMFGKNTSRRWFRVSYVPAGNDQKLIISYSSSKTSKEPRGWLYIEDVSGVYCRRDMIEVVSPARTLRFKGETTVEHRLWSDSLHRLCNPPKPTSAKSIEEEKRLETERVQQEQRRQEKLRAQDRDRIADPKKTREHVDSFRERKSITADASDRYDLPPSSSRRQSTPESGRQSRLEHKRRGSDSGSGQDNDSDEDEEDAAPRRRQSLEPAAPPPREPSPRRHSATEMRREQPANDDDRRGSISRRDRSDEEEEEEGDDDSDEDSDEDGVEQASRLASTERRPSLLVASIKSLSPVVCEPKMAAPTPRSAKPSDSDDDEESDDVAPQQRVTPRAESPVKRAIAAAPEEERVVIDAPHSPVRKVTKNTDYFDDSEADDDREQDTNNKRQPTAPTSDIRADNNFADDDWDAEEDQPTTRTKAPSPEKVHRGAVGTGGVAADANFASEDWD